MLASTWQRKRDQASERIGGYQGALDFLDQLPDAVARRVLKPAMQAADLVGQRAAQAEAQRHRSKRNRPHLDTTAGAAEAVRGQTVVGKVGYFGDAGSHGWLAEHGHRIVLGGSVARINPNRRDYGQAGRELAPGSSFKVYHANQSRYRGRERALETYLEAATGMGHFRATSRLLSDIDAANRGGQESELLRGALETGGVYQTRNRRTGGHGHVAGQVPPHPILAPAYEKSKGAMEQVFASEVIYRAEQTAQRLAKQTGSIQQS
jgi:hypothetical protein